MAGIVDFVQSMLPVLVAELPGPTWWHVYLTLFAAAGAVIALSAIVASILVWVLYGLFAGEIMMCLVAGLCHR
jgi:hypothetical protein